jgi:hypothetical protein
MSQKTYCFQWKWLWQLLLVGALGHSSVALAQASHDTASFTLGNAKLQNLGGATIAQPRRLVLLNVTHPGHDQTLVEQYWRDEHLRPRRQAHFTLRGKLELASAQGTAHYLLVQLLSRDSLVLVTVDTLGRVVAQARQALAVRRGLFGASDIGLEKADAFITIEQQRENTCRLVCRSANLAVRWEKTFGPTPSAMLTATAADSTHLWVILMADYDKRHPLSTAVCLDLATGRELARVALTNEQARRVPTVAEMGPGHTLLVAGHAFEGEAAILRRTGDLFFQRLGPDGRILTDQLTDFEKEPELHGAAAERVQWQLLWPLARGGVQLVGETYTSTSMGGGILKGSLTMGLAGQTVLRPKDVVSVQLTASGQVEKLRIVPLPLDKGDFSYPYYREGRIMARMAMEAGAFRTRGVAADSTVLVLRSPQQVQTLNLQSGQLHAVRPAPYKGLADVLYIGEDFVIVAEARPAKHTLRLLRVPLAAVGK